jgi:hypothetical protein
MGKTMYKGFDKDLKCRGYQYEEGKEYVLEGEARACVGGFHTCENPFDVFGFYAPNESHRFCEVEGSGKEDKQDKKSSFEKIKIVAEIGLGGLIKAGVKFCLDRVKWTDEPSATGDYSGASATGDYSGASATGNCSGASATGYYSGASATGHYSGASATGYKSGASAGKGSVALSVGRDTRAKGSLGSWIVLTQCHKSEEDEQDYIDLVKVAKVEGKRIKADTWYTLKEGKFVLADDDDY